MMTRRQVLLALLAAPFTPVRRMTDPQLGVSIRFVRAFDPRMFDSPEFRALDAAAMHVYRNFTVQGGAVRVNQAAEGPVLEYIPPSDVHDLKRTFYGGDPISTIDGFTWSPPDA